jgi:hypothetical protein
MAELKRSMGEQAIVTSSTAEQFKNQPTTQNTIIVERLDVDVKAGKKFFVVKGGKYQKHGIRIWPETLKHAGIDPEAIPLAGVVPKKRWEAVFTMKGDRPDSVVKLNDLG